LLQKKLVVKKFGVKNIPRKYTFNIGDFFCSGLLNLYAELAVKKCKEIAQVVSVKSKFLEKNI